MCGHTFDWHSGAGAGGRVGREAVVGTWCTEAKDAAEGAAVHRTPPTEGN